MKMRIMGTEQECSQFVKMLLKSVPDGYIRNISKWYRNERKTAYSNEGRVYIEFERIPDNRKLIE